MNTLLVILSAVANSLWQAFAVAALVWLALRFLPRINAATRYAIWWATLGVVLILPIAPRLILTMLPHPQPAAVTAMKTPPTAGPAFTVEPVIVTVAPGRTAVWPVAILAVWAAILLWRLIQIVRSYFFLRSVKRRAAVSPIPLPAIPRHADLLISPDIVSPMAVGFLRPAVVLPESLLEELSEPEREHVLLHESAHLAKYDDWSNLAMRLLAGALALHPVAIWILWRIEREREMACDDWVVARTGAARPYAASLAHLFELRRARRGEILASGIFGSSSRLGDRIEMLLRYGRTFSPRASAAGVVASTVVLGALLLAGSLTPRWIAFAQEPARLAFDVATVKPNRSGRAGFDGFQISHGSLTVRNVSLKMLIEAAYSIQGARISSGPAWLSSDRYDVVAKGAPGANKPQVWLMLRSLLADRFALRLANESRELPVYSLEVGKNGPKLRKRDDAECEQPPPTAASGALILRSCGGVAIVWGPQGGYMFGEKVATSAIGDSLSDVVDRPVVDRTALAGTFDVDLKWTPDGYRPFAAEGEARRPVDSPEPGPSIFTAVQDQLGLKLVATKGSVQILVIDHAEKPYAN